MVFVRCKLVHVHVHVCTRTYFMYLRTECCVCVCVCVVLPLFFFWRGFHVVSSATAGVPTQTPSGLTATQQLNDAAVHGSIGIQTEHHPSIVVRGVFARDEHCAAPANLSMGACPCRQIRALLAVCSRRHGK